MSATTAGALKTLIEAAGLSLAAYRDEAPDASTLPYVTIAEAISVVPTDSFNAFDDSQGHVTEQAQVDLWQQWHNPSTGVLSESYTLPDALTKALSGAGLSAARTSVQGVRVLSVRRLTESDSDLVHHAITVEVKRTLS